MVGRVEQSGKDIRGNRIRKKLRAHIPAFMDRTIKPARFFITKGAILIWPVGSVVCHSLPLMPSVESQQMLQKPRVQTLLNEIRQAIQLFQAMCLVVYG